jgi:DNA-binding MarR family transcriptional regulator
MRPVGSDQSQASLTLNDVFGTRGQIQLLRILATETEGSIASPEVAARTGMTTSGVRKALRRLAQAGVVEKLGTGKSTRYVLRREGELAEEIVRLFELERGSVAPGGDRTERGTGSPSEQGNGNGTAKGNGGRDGNGGFSARDGAGGHDVSAETPFGPLSAKTPGDGAADVDTSEDNGPSTPARELSPGSPEFHGALVALLEEELSLIRRARENVLEKLEQRDPGNGHDLWEWRKILDTYPLPRLLHFLESESPRALRLRKCSPFAEVISDRERQRLSELAQRVH